jgi:hypothetical protein
LDPKNATYLSAPPVFAQNASLIPSSWPEKNPDNIA